MKLFLYRLCQCTWGLPQTILGLFVFINEDKNVAGTGRTQKILDHEYGHTIQSLLLGPLYLLIIGIPSWLWCNVPYFRKMGKWVERKSTVLNVLLSPL